MLGYIHGGGKCGTGGCRVGKGEWERGSSWVLDRQCETKDPSPKFSTLSSHSSSEDLLQSLLCQEIQ